MEHPTEKMKKSITDKNKLFLRAAQFEGWNIRQQRSKKSLFLSSSYFYSKTQKNA